MSFSRPPEVEPTLPESAHRKPLLAFRRPTHVADPGVPLADAIAEPSPSTEAEREHSKAVKPPKAPRIPKSERPPKPPKEPRPPKPPKPPLTPAQKARRKRLAGLAAGLVSLLVIAGIAYGAYFTYMKVLAPMPAEEYRAMALQYLGEMEAAITAPYSAVSTATGVGVQTIDAAGFEASASAARSAIARIRTLRPPAEYRAIHDRILTGVGVLERSLTVTEALLAGANDPAAQAAAEQALKEQADSGAQASLNDLVEAYFELRSAP
jgi:hypothetical protein